MKRVLAIAVLAVAALAVPASASTACVTLHLDVNGTVIDQAPCV